MRWGVLLALLGLAAGEPLWADPSAAQSLLEHCARVADASEHGVDALSHDCPQIEAAVHTLGLDPLLPAHWQKTASARALADLAALADRYAAPSPSLRLDAARLKSIAHTLEPPPTPLSMWERIEAWLRNWLAPNGDSTSSWLRFLPHWHLSPLAARLLFGALAALIIIGVAALIVRELKASGLIGGTRRGRVPRRATVATRATDSASLDLGALDSALPRDRPVVLLRILVGALTRSRRLGHDRNLTCRELTAKARFDSPLQREQFEQVALLAERALYASHALVPPAIPEDLLTKARALHAELLATSRLEPASS